MRHTNTYIQINLSPAIHDIWNSVSIIQNKTDLVLEDVEQEEPRQKVKEMKEEPQPQNKENLTLSKKGVSTTHPVLYPVSISEGSYLLLSTMSKY